MRRALILTLMCAAAAACAPAALAGEDAKERRSESLRDRIDDLQQEVESLTEDVEDLGEPVEEFELFDQCAYTIGVTQFGTWGGATGFLFGPAGTMRRPALATDMRGFGVPQYDFLAFPGEEPPSIECNEDPGQDTSDES
jgi:hypothetical protein